MATSPFKAGGPLADDHAKVYVSRQADQDVIEHLLAMDYLLLIEPRQQGKTSLIYHVKRHLALSNITLVYIDVTTPDHSSEENWYQTFCPRILRQIPNIIGPGQWPDLPRTSSDWRNFLSEIASSLTQTNKKVVIALDEIGAMTFPGATEFFSVLRDIFNSRGFENELTHLTFLHSGVFHPRDLIKDENVSPFNIAHHIRLKDFTLEQVQELVSKGSWPLEQAVSLAERIHYWTDGQPYMTQLLCTYLGPNALPSDVDAGIERLRREDGNHLPPILKRLNQNNKLLEYVGEVRSGRHIMFYPTQHERQAQLELLGVLKADENGYAYIRNRIYELALYPHDNSTSMIPVQLNTPSESSDPIPIDDLGLAHDLRMLEMQYNIKNVRNLLINGFTESELRNDLCLFEEAFKPLFSQLSENMSKADLTAYIIQYAERTMKFEPLLTWSRALNSAAFKQYQPYWNSEVNVILFLAADPSDTTRIRFGEELREIQEKLQLSKLRERFELHQRMSVRPSDITQALLDVNPHIVHFSGHCTDTGSLCFENQHGQTHLVEPKVLAVVFKQFSSSVNCVLLNTCYSDILANAIGKHVKYVIGTKQAIDDATAIAFTVGFYQALGAGYEIEEAYNLGCAQIGLESVSEYLMPVLIKKGQVQP